MTRFFTTLLVSVILTAAHGQSTLTPHTAAQSKLPDWVRLMYSADPDPGAVQAAYDAHYATHPFVKNTHTQYFKRWKRELGHAQVPKDPTQRATYALDLHQYLNATAELAASRAANWSCTSCAGAPSRATWIGASPFPSASTRTSASMSGTTP